MDFDKLVDVYEKLEKTSSGNTIREILADFFKEVPKNKVKVIAYLTLGKLAADYDDVVLGFAEKSVLKAIGSAGATDSSRVKKLMQELGDVGLVAAEVMKKKPMTLVPIGKLTIDEFHDKLLAIASSSGEGSQDKKTQVLASMLQKASSKGAKYVTRIALGTLRMGVGDMAVLDALAIAFTGDKKNKEILEKAYNLCPDFGLIAETLSEKGLEGIEKLGVHVGRPIKMMLAQRIADLEDVHKRFEGDFTVEGKYDGERVQAHKDVHGKISLFSRRLDNITSQFPDVVKAMEDRIDAKTFIVEGEIIAVDAKGKPLPFQTLMQRKRKYDVAEYAKKVPVQVKLFDLLYCDGKVYMEKSFPVRTGKLTEIVKKSTRVMVAEHIITDDISKLDDFFKNMLKSGYEGVIIKSRAEDSFYQAGTRGWNWIKWKKEYVKDMVDTFDLVLIGAYYGKGRRSGVYGALLCASYNNREDVFESFCKIGTGLSDELLESLPEKMRNLESKKKPARVKVSKDMEPDIWFKPEIVVEVSGAEVTKSPNHTCADGLALRFPRFLGFRESKKAEQATTSEEIEELFFM